MGAEPKLHCHGRACHRRRAGHPESLGGGERRDLEPGAYRNLWPRADRRRDFSSRSGVWLPAWRALRSRADDERPFDHSRHRLPHDCVAAGGGVLRLRPRLPFARPDRWAVYSTATGIAIPCLIALTFATNVLLPITAISVIGYGWVSAIAALLLVRGTACDGQKLRQSHNISQRPSRIRPT